MTHQGTHLEKYTDSTGSLLEPHSGSPSRDKKSLRKEPGHQNTVWVCKTICTQKAIGCVDLDSDMYVYKYNYVYTCMCVRTYVCMYVCMYVHTHTSMHACMHACMYI